MYRSIAIFFLLFLLCLAGISQTNSIVPKPLQEQPGKGQFMISSKTVIHSDSICLPSAQYLQRYLDSFYQLHLALVISNDHSSAADGIQLQSDVQAESPEAYLLQIAPGKINVHGDAAGVFYGVQSLIQLLPVGHLSTLTVAALTIRDKPRFAWRGMSLDVCRHFFSVAEVKKYLDVMAHYKMNRFHWHLTDDEGWRIQIDHYPLLTAVGSKMNEWAAAKKFRPLSNITDGGTSGFYTKAEIREVIQYAKDRYIDVLPEIEMPGHCEAAVYAYPWLGCADSTGEKQKQKPFPRTRMYDPSERVFGFLDTVLSEIIDLFPFGYVHIGGDEAEMKDWLKSPAAVALMNKAGLKNEKEVQSYFIKRMEQFLLAHGRKMIGWDEILEGGLAPGATVMSWRGEDGGIKAAKMGHPVIMTPLPYVYFDAPQSDDPTEPIGWNYPLSWQHTYEYNPVPAVLNEKESALVMGVQGNIWAEKIPSDAHLEYMVYPRAIAVAEDAWTDLSNKNLQSFTARLDKQFQLLQLWRVNARMPDIEGMHNTTTNLLKGYWQLSFPILDAKIFYTLNGTKPDSSKNLYHGRIVFDFTKQDSMLIKTMVVSARSAQRRYQRALLRKVTIPAPLLQPYQPTIHYSLYSKQLEPDSLEQTKPFATGKLNWVSLPADSALAPFHTALLTGEIQIKKAGQYHIRIGSDGETILTIADVEVINNDGYHGTQERETVLLLTAGYYPFRLWYSNEDDGKVLQLKILPAEIHID